MDPKQLEQAINEWWKSTETERLLLGNDQDLIRELTGRSWLTVDAISYFKVGDNIESGYNYILHLHIKKGGLLPMGVKFLDLRLQSLQEGYRGT